jgi:hypothetical protein
MFQGSADALEINVYKFYDDSVIVCLFRSADKLMFKTGYGFLHLRPYINSQLNIRRIIIYLLSFVRILIMTLR